MDSSQRGQTGPWSGSASVANRSVFVIHRSMVGTWAGAPARPGSNLGAVSRFPPGSRCWSTHLAGFSSVADALHQAPSSAPPMHALQHRELI
ncbi:hypothetical protein GCM10009664_45440 [Kitasatospora gansuensis]